MALTSAHLVALRAAKAPKGTNRIRTARDLAGLTQVELAAAVSLTQPVISDLERSRWSETSLTTAARLADFFGCAIEDLFPSRVRSANPQRGAVAVTESAQTERGEHGVAEQVVAESARHASDSAEQPFDGLRDTAGEITSESAVRR